MSDYSIVPNAALAATASAIYTKSGSQAMIEFDHNTGFASAVSNIPNGDDRKDLCEPKDVDFIDFDGRLLYSYTAQEFLALSALPDNPSYDGLIAQGWNWTLADAKEYVGQYGALVIGQNYTTNDGKTRIYVHIPLELTNISAPAALKLPLYIDRVIDSAYTINWNDGTVENYTVSGSGWASYSHVYTEPGDYVITINVTSGEICLGYLYSNNSLLGAYPIWKSVVNKIEIGNRVVKLGRQPFNNFVNMKSISIPTTCTGLETTVDYTVFGDNESLLGVVFPSEMVGKDRSIFNDRGLQCLKYVAVPKSMVRFQMGTYPYALRKLTLPPQAPVDNTQLNVRLYDPGRITHFIVPGSYTSIQAETCRNSLIKKLTIPASVTSIGSSAFAYNNFLEEVHMLPVSPPTLSSSNVFNQAPSSLVIYVPYSVDHSILTAYQTATNWSTYASQMQEEPQ